MLVLVGAQDFERRKQQLSLNLCVGLAHAFQTRHDMGGKVFTCFVGSYHKFQLLVVSRNYVHGPCCRLSDNDVLLKSHAADALVVNKIKSW